MIRTAAVHIMHVPVVVGTSKLDQRYLDWIHAVRALEMNMVFCTGYWRSADSALEMALFSL
jgi:hypothetical protein